VGACSASAPLLPDAAAASAGSAGGGSLAGAALANSVPLLARRFPDSSVRANCDNSLSGMIENIQRKYKHDLQHIWLPLQLHLLFRDTHQQGRHTVGRDGGNHLAHKIGGGVARIINTQHCDQPRNDTLLKHNAHSFVFQASERVLHTSKSVNTSPTFSTHHGTKSPSGLLHNHPELIVFYA